MGWGVISNDVRETVASSANNMGFGPVWSLDNDGVWIGFGTIWSWGLIEFDPIWGCSLSGVGPMEFDPNWTPILIHIDIESMYQDIGDSFER